MVLTWRSKVTFDNAGNYTFFNFHLTVDKGTYSILMDSLLVIKPDTSGFIKFNYTIPTLSFDTSKVITQPNPYAGYEFVNDTIPFQASNNNLVLATRWLAKSTGPILPGGDTLILNQAITHFKKH